MKLCELVTEMRFRKLFNIVPIALPNFFTFDALINLIIDKEERKYFSNALILMLLILLILLVSAYIMY